SFAKRNSSRQTEANFFTCFCLPARGSAAFSCSASISYANTIWYRTGPSSLSSSRRRCAFAARLLGVLEVRAQSLPVTEGNVRASEAMPTLQALVDSLSDFGDKTALLALTKHGEERWSFRTLAERARAFADRLPRDGIRAGDSVVLYAENRPEWIAAALGVFRARAVVSPSDVQFGDNDLAHILRDSVARAVIPTLRRAPRIEKLARTKLILLDDEQIFARGEASEPPFVRPSDPAVLFYTSGTTGAPKGVPLTHQNIASQFEVIATIDLVGAGDRVQLPLPLHHVYPSVLGMLAPLSLGLPIVLPSSLTGQQLFRALRQGKVTAIVGVPRLYSALVGGINARVASSGRIARSLFSRLLAL